MSASLTPSPGAAGFREGETGTGLAAVRDATALTYPGERGAAETAAAARNRIHWIAGQVTGERVLDVGTGDGILPVLLGREGFRVVGIDIDAAAIARADGMLAAEAETVRDRVEFRNTGLFQDDFESPFDTVVLGDVLAQIANVPNFLRMAVGHLKDEGRLVLTTAFGMRPGPDRKNGFFLSDVEQALGCHGRIARLDVSGGHIRAILVKGAPDQAVSGALVTPLLAQTERAAAEVQKTLWQRIGEHEALLQRIGDERDQARRAEAAARRAHEMLKLEFEERLAEFERQGDQLQEARAAARRAAAKQEDATSSAEQAHAQLAVAAERLAETERKLEESRAESETARSDAEALRQELSEERATRSMAETKAAERLAEAERKLEESRAESETARSDAEALRQELSEERATRSMAETQAVERKEAFVALRTEKEALHGELSETRAARETAHAQLVELKAAYLALEEENRTLSARLDEAELQGVADDAVAAAETGETPPEDGLADQAARLGRVIGHLLRDLEVSAGQAAERCLRRARDLQQEDPATSCCLTAVAHDLAPGRWSAKAHGFGLLRAGFPALAADVLSRLRGEDAPGLSSLEQRQFDRLMAAMDTRDRAAVADLADCRLTASSLRVATIMDEFTYAAYAPECDLMQLTPEAWERELETFGPQVLLLESAWRGKDGKWGSKVGHLSPDVRQIIAWCRARDIPTVFWNKEDPVHFETFLTTASQVDMVCTTDIDCVGRYKAALGHDRVHFLPFACQPESHNPIELFDRRDAFCFAGAYYKRYPDRTRDLGNFVDRLPDFRPLEIYDRNFGKDHPDYMFPESYRPFIVGTLPPEEIDRAYKGYRYGINLNSIKNSQTMFARRVYELMASNTVVVSNYSRGLRHMFGDLVISSDNCGEILRRLQSTDLERLRLAGLRKVMLEHTYGVRLAYLARKLGFETGGDSLPPVTVVAHAGSQADIAAILAQVGRQAGVAVSLVLVLAPEIAELADGLDGLDGEAVMALPEARAEALRVGDVIAQEAWIAPMVAGDHYGANYLRDLVLATRYSDAAVIGKAAHHGMEDGRPVLRNEAAAYRPAKALMLRRALVSRGMAAAAPLAAWARVLPEAELTTREADGLAIDPFNYCEGGSLETGQPGAGVAEAVDDLPGPDSGCALADLTLRAETAPPAQPAATDAPVVAGNRLLADVEHPKDGHVTWQVRGTAVHVSSTLPESKHVYLYQPADHAAGDLAPNGVLELFLETKPGLNLQWACLFLDGNGERLGHVMAVANRNLCADLPEGTARLRFGLRVYGAGEADVTRLVLGRRPLSPVPLLSKARALVLTNHYPSHDDIYRNGFVHSRVRAYRARGERVDVFRLRPDHDLSFHEYENIDCMTGAPEQLDLMLGQGIYETVCVHFLDAAMWDVLAPHVASGLRVVVWVHGAEVQPWWRRKFNYQDDAELAAAKEVSEQRLAFWRGVLADPPANLHFVFVSRYFAEEVMEDVGLRLPEESYSIIHNPINTEVFEYVPKPPEQRLKILSIRPFASAKYANDLSVKAILELAEKPFFDELEFHIVGKGKLFKEVLEPLQNIKNVTVEERFLVQAEIGELHREYGIFLNPTRMDAQGVSRDEAMSSGLVPVTTDVAAIPEFVDESCGFLAPPEDAAGLAGAIETLYHDPDRFLAMSEAAAKRVRRQSAAARIIGMELHLMTASTAREGGE